MNKQPLNRKQCKDIQVDILNYIDKICKKMNIEYSLAYGTLLGAVRHQGFIPWDDDIDVFLMREDYDKLILKLKQNSNEKYKIIDDTNGTYYYPFAKIVDMGTIAKMEDNTTEHGIWVDIFPLDNLPDNPIKRWMHLKCCFMYRSVIIAMTTDFRASNLGKKNIKYFLNNIANIIGKQNIIKQYIALIRAYIGQKTEYVGCLSSPYIEREMLERNKLKVMTRMLFEGKEYSAIKEWDYYLRKLYGNYMILPPLEKRRVHSITAWKIKNK